MVVGGMRVANAVFLFIYIFWRGVGNEAPNFVEAFDFAACHFSISLSLHVDVGAGRECRSFL